MRFSANNDSFELDNACNRQWGGKKTALIPLFLALLLVAVSPVSGKDFWEKKDYKEWSKNECNKMLQDSPWAKTYKITRPGLMSRGADYTGEDPYVQYNVRLRSAFPIRQAMVRMAQIENKYDKLTPEQKKQFDESAKAYFTTDYSNIVLVSIEYGTNQQAEIANLIRYWQTQTTELLQSTTYLIGAGDMKIPLQQYIPGQGATQEFQFIFPRQYEGKPVLTPSDKSLKLEFEYPASGGQSGGQALIEFKVDKMMIGEELIY
jgi:hypothetical protein